VLAWKLAEPVERVHAQRSARAVLAWKLAEPVERVRMWPPA